MQQAAKGRCAAMALVAHACDAVERVRGLQQGLEATLLRQREDLAQALGKRIEHAAKEAEEAALSRAAALLQPQLSELQRRLEVEAGAAAEAAGAAQGRLAALEERLEAAGRELGALRIRSQRGEEQLQELTVGLAEEGRLRIARCQELAHSAAELANAAAREQAVREAMGATAAQALEEVAGAGEATRQAQKRAEVQLAELSKELAAQGARHTVRLDEQLAACLKEATHRVDDAAGLLEAAVRKASERANRQVEECQKRADSALAAIAAALREEQESAANKSCASADAFASQRVDEASEQLREEMACLGRRLESDHSEAIAKIWEAVARWEGRLGGERAQHLAELQTLAKGHAVKVNFLNTATVGKKATEERGLPGSGSLGAVAGGGPDLHHLSLKARGEALLRGELQELRAAMGDLEARVTQDTEMIRAEVQARASNHETYTRLEATAAELSARINRLRSDSDEARDRSRKELLTLSNEVTSLQAASTCLADAVVKALQALGLLDSTSDPPLAAGPASGSARSATAAEKAHACREPALSAAVAATPRGSRPRTGGQTRIEDLLLWEKSGHSLAARVVATTEAAMAAATSPVVARGGRAAAAVA